MFQKKCPPPETDTHLDEDENTSGPLFVNLVKRLTALDATIVDAIAAGTLKMIDITALRLSNMKIVAIKLATNLEV